MQTKTLSLREIVPYENNPRKNDKAVDAVAESIRQCGYIAPVIVDENNVILAGHTRLKALETLGYDKIPVIEAKGLTEEQKRKYRLLDNKTAELAEWDFALLAEELDGLDFGALDIFESTEEPINYIDTLLEESFVTKQESPPYFDVTFTFESKNREMVEAYLKEHGKAALTEKLLAWMGGARNA